jgi:hypothetical protein
MVGFDLMCVLLTILGLTILGVKKRSLYMNMYIVEYNTD